MKRQDPAIAAQTSAGKIAGLAYAGPCRWELEVELQRKLKSSRIVRRSRLARRASSRARGGIAHRIHAAHVEVVQHIESIGDHLQIYALRHWDLLRNAQINLKKARLVEGIAAQISGAPGRRHWYGRARRN